IGSGPRSTQSSMAWSKSTARIQPSSSAAVIGGSRVTGSSTATSGAPVPDGPQRLEVARPRGARHLDAVQPVDQAAELGVAERPGIHPGMGDPEDVDEALQVG